MARPHFDGFTLGVAFASLVIFFAGIVGDYFWPMPQQSTCWLKSDLLQKEP